MSIGYRIWLRVSHSAPCTRRTFLLAALGGVAAGVSHYSLANDQPEACVQISWLHESIADKDAAAELGRAYLKAHPQHRRCRALIADIEQALENEGVSIFPENDADRIIKALQRVVRREYRHDDVVAVAGWVLSNTEARLYALAALTR